MGCKKQTGKKNCAYLNFVIKIFLNGNRESIYCNNQRVNSSEVKYFQPEWIVSYNGVRYPKIKIGRRLDKHEEFFLRIKTKRVRRVGNRIIDIIVIVIKTRKLKNQENMITCTDYNDQRQRNKMF